MRRLACLLPPLGLLVLLTAADRPAGYLGGATVDLTGIIPPAPVAGDIRDRADHDVYLRMKDGIGGERWRRATSDVVYATPTMEQDFACATGLRLDPDHFPATTRLLDNASADTGRANEAAKRFYQHPRPFHADNGETCETKESLGASLDYPSGHTTKGWTFGLVLADVMPDRAAAILTRARAYGESRIACRVHTMSAVDTGRLGATVTMATVRQTPGYLADLVAARAEIAAARASGPAPNAAGCSAEHKALDRSVLADLGK